MRYIYRSIRLPDNVNDGLNEMAVRERRSANAQIIVLIEAAIAEMAKEKAAA